LLQIAIHGGCIYIALPIHKGSEHGAMMKWQQGIFAWGVNDCDDPCDIFN
jgi:hypothetical protein